MTTFNIAPYARMAGQTFNFVVQNAPTGVFRITSLCTAAVTIGAVGELALRLVQAVGPQKLTDWSDRFSSWTRDNGVNIRPMQYMTPKSLMITAVATGILSVATWEVTGLLFGAPNPVYNNILSQFSPFRICSDSIIGIQFN